MLEGQLLSKDKKSTRYSLFIKHFLMLHTLFYKVVDRNEKSVILGHHKESGIRYLSLVSPLNNNLAFIHGKKFLCGSCGIQVGGCKTLVQSKTQEIHSESQAYTQAADLATGVSATGPETTLYHWGLSYIPIWLGFYHQYHKPRCLKGVAPTCALVIDLQTLV